MVAAALSRPTPTPVIPLGNLHRFTGWPLCHFVVEDQGMEHGLRLQDQRARWLDLLDGRWLQRGPAGVQNPGP